MTFRRMSLFILGLAGMAGPGVASNSFYTNATQPSFNSLVTGLTETPIDFLTLTTVANGLEDLGTGVIFQDQSSGSAGIQAISSCTTSCPDGGMQTLPPSNFSLNIIVPATYTAISFEVLYNAAHGTGNSVTVSATGFSSQGVTTATSPQFIGAVTLSGISGLSLGGLPQTFEIDDFNVYSQGSSTPEGSTLFLLGAGLILIGLVRRRRRAAALS